MNFLMPEQLMNQIVTILQELPAKNVYNIIKQIEALPREEIKKD